MYELLYTQSDAISRRSSCPVARPVGAPVAWRCRWAVELWEQQAACGSGVAVRGVQRTEAARANGTVFDLRAPPAGLPPGVLRCGWAVELREQEVASGSGEFPS